MSMLALSISMEWRLEMPLCSFRLHRLLLAVVGICILYEGIYPANDGEVSLDGRFFIDSVLFVA